MTTAAKLFTFSVDNSPAEVEVLSTNTLFDLVDIGFEVCNPRPEETAEDHLWDIRYQSGKKGNMKKFVYCGPCTVEEIMGPYEDPCLDANTTALAELSPLLKKGSTLVLNYDYGTTTKHTFTVLSTKTVKDQRVDCFPRRKPEPLRYFKPFRIHEIYLDAEYAALDHWIFEREGCTQVNLFQPGRKHCYGYLENESISEARMIYVADKPQSLNHYLDCLNVAARIKKGSSYSWHSVVVLPEGSKKIDKYCQDLEEGFIDCAVVEHNNDDDDADIPTLVKAFPKVAALAGYRKDKAIKKGWIRYKDNTLMVVTGMGGTSSCPRAPKGTAYEGAGFHVPGPSDEVLLRCQMELNSLHALFCTVEGFLQTL